MEMKVAEALFDAMLNTGCEEIRFRNDYSGRYMYGKECCAISGDFNWCQVAVAWAQACQDDDELDPSDLSFSWDSMGLGTVIY